MRRENQPKSHTVPNPLEAPAPHLLVEWPSWWKVFLRNLADLFQRVARSRPPTRASRRPGRRRSWPDVFVDRRLPVSSVPAIVIGPHLNPGGAMGRFQVGLDASGAVLADSGAPGRERLLPDLGVSAGPSGRNPRTPRRARKRKAHRPLRGSTYAPRRRTRTTPSRPSSRRRLRQRLL